MGAAVVEGKEIAQSVYDELRVEIPQLIRRTGRRPVLVSVYVGAHPAIEIYIRSQNRAARSLGIEYRWYQLPDTAEEHEVLRRIDQLNHDPEVTGVILQLPLPAHLRRSVLVNAIDPLKDVDGTHPENVGAALIGEMRIGSCTALAVMRMLDTTGVAMEGKEAVIVGHSELVGKPVSLMLLDRQATVTICHIATARRGLLADHVRRAEILVVAVGSPEVIKGDWIRPGAAVVDVGINQVGKRLVGDVEFAPAWERAAFITPVPGGVGPVTVAMLMQNTVKAFKAQMNNHAEGDQSGT
ncbi:MAG TPA: bifunctional 5,10-methylenetetrahydrofolate dehydrogenase/5,10-methenyltetrahydrofolate cyclohydrolase [Methylomirabilota bacterium]|nr:bifunctional 5,10-methylenetetrahydrofolate dehydrogenase/5,10-methenyltetrahydrofolate cyclohydrolase [Methylomirabilota bacterium]